MKTDDAIAKLNDDVLWAQTHRAAWAEQGALVELLRFLGEVDARKMYLELGFNSLWAFMLSLHFSESQCAARITAAKVLRRYPSVAHDLETGRLHLTAVAMVARCRSPQLAASCKPRESSSILMRMTSRPGL